MTIDHAVPGMVPEHHPEGQQRPQWIGPISHSTDAGCSEYAAYHAAIREGEAWARRMDAEDDSTDPPATDDNAGGRRGWSAAFRPVTVVREPAEGCPVCGSLLMLPGDPYCPVCKATRKMEV